MSAGYGNDRLLPMFLEQETISMQVEADQAAVVQVLAAALKMVPRLSWQLR